MTLLKWSKRIGAFVLAVLVARSGSPSGAGPATYPLAYVYPPGVDVSVTRSFDPQDVSSVSPGSTIRVTVDVANGEDVPLRGFYYSDQVPDGWTVGDVAVSIDGVPLADVVQGQDAPGTVYSGLTPHYWALEMPQGGGAFFPLHPVPPGGGRARIVYTLTVGAGSAYSAGRDAWAGWLETAPDGTAVFGYQGYADFSAAPRMGVPPFSVRFSDRSAGNVLTRTWHFGDGITATTTLPEISHSYADLGVYSVSLTVGDGVGSDTCTRPDYIYVVEVVHNLYLPLLLRTNSSIVQGERVN